jgi:oligopeptide/dipeptide ABC transporter ATP-binding protein
MNESILEIRNLTTRFSTRQGDLTAVDGVNLSVQSGETVCLVGESGCGKSVAALSVMRLIPIPPGMVTGEILFQGKDLLKLTGSEMRAIRGNRISMIFQEPMSSLNPVFTVGRQIEEVLRKHRGMGRNEARAVAAKMLGLVGIPDPASRISDYPHQLSGGMLQRVMIAIALSCRPRLMIADEPTTALDVTIQAQILALIRRLREEVGMAVLFITHDLGVVAEIARRVAVMYAGRIVEQAEVGELFTRPLHPYTVGLFRSLPKIGGIGSRLTPIPGSVPSLIGLPPGCAFHDRCSRAQPLCREAAPPWEETFPDHFSRCHFSSEAL